MVTALSFSVDGVKVPDDRYYARVSADPRAAMHKGCDRLANIYGTYFTANGPWEDAYLERTAKEIVPLVATCHPELAEKIRKAVQYVWQNRTPTADEAAIVADLEKIRKIREGIGA